MNLSQQENHTLALAQPSLNTSFFLVTFFIRPLSLQIDSLERIVSRRWWWWCIVGCHARKRQEWLKGLMINPVRNSVTSSPVRDEFPST